MFAKIITVDTEVRYKDLKPKTLFKLHSRDSEIVWMVIPKHHKISGRFALDMLDGSVCTINEESICYPIGTLEIIDEN
jgi:hypothetical protein